MLSQQHLKHRVGGYETAEPAIINDGEGRLIVVDGFPGRMLLHG